jgi:transposase
MAKWKNGAVNHAGTYFKVWDSWGLKNYNFRSASFSEDARGRWYFNVVVEFEAEASTGASAVGIVLGCKDAATPSSTKFAEIPLN